MLTYALKKEPGLPLYESLYRCIRDDILSGQLMPGEKLPSKRALATNLEVSKITVEGAYEQLLGEGYIRSVEKVGYFVEEVRERELLREHYVPLDPPPALDEPKIDLTGNGPVKFPFSVWSRLQREVMLDMGENLLLPSPSRGAPELRRALSYHLYQFRGLEVDPERILIGAGTDFLYNILVQLLGRDRIYGVEDPGYGKTHRIYEAAGATCNWVPVDKEGVIPDGLGNTQILHISPSHHFPTGVILSARRRRMLMNWLAGDDHRWIIEDDYDCEFRYQARPIEALQRQNPNRVIYMNTFSKTLAPSIRISYMVLPPALMKRFQKQLGFYSSTVPSFVQHTLTRFLEQGYYEKHLNRMRKFYKLRRDRLMAAIENSPHKEKLTVLEQNAGLHFLLRVDTKLTDAQLVAQWGKLGLKVRTLSSYYHGGDSPDTHTLVINYSGLGDHALTALEQLLQDPSAEIM